MIGNRQVEVRVYDIENTNKPSDTLVVKNIDPTINTKSLEQFFTGNCGISRKRTKDGNYHK